MVATTLFVAGSIRSMLDVFGTPTQTLPRSQADLVRATRADLADLDGCDDDTRSVPLR